MSVLDKVYQGTQMMKMNEALLPNRVLLPIRVESIAEIVRRKLFLSNHYFLDSPLEAYRVTSPPSSCQKSPDEPWQRLEFPSPLSSPELLSLLPNLEIPSNEETTEVLEFTSTPPVSPLSTSSADFLLSLPLSSFPLSSAVEPLRVPIAKKGPEVSPLLLSSREELPNLSSLSEVRSPSYVPRSLLSEIEAKKSLQETEKKCHRETILEALQKKK